MASSSEHTHNRYIQQAEWTAELRKYLFAKAELNQRSRVLELGSGTGAILRDNAELSNLHALDIDKASLDHSKAHLPGAHYMHADGHNLPYSNAAFDISYCHFLLLWVNNPLLILREMQRVTRKGGWMIAMAEPDYGGRIDYPEQLKKLGKWQIEALQARGADTGMGRRLLSLFSAMGAQDIEYGVMGLQSNPLDREEAKAEQETLHSDFADQVGQAELADLLSIENQAIKAGTRVLFVPTFYAIGRIG